MRKMRRLEAEEACEKNTYAGKNCPKGRINFPVGEDLAEHTMPCVQKNLVRGRDRTMREKGIIDIHDEYIKFRKG